MSRPSVLALLAGMLGVLFASVFGLHHHSGAADESLVLEGGVRILRGEVPYRDFQLYHAPGAMLMAATVFKIFGIHIYVARGLMLLIAFFLCAAVVLVSTELMDSRYALFPGLLVGVACLPAYPIVIYHWIASVFLLVAFYWFLLSRRKGQRWLLLAGCGVGAAALCLQSEGAAGLVSLTVALMVGCGRDIKTFLKDWAVFIAGISALWLPFLFLLFTLGAFEAFWQQAIMRALSRIHKLHAYPYSFQEFVIEPWVPGLDWHGVCLTIPETFRYATLLIVLGATIIAGLRKGGVHRDFGLLVLVWFVLKKERLDPTYANFLTPLWSIGAVWLLAQLKQTPRRTLMGVLGVVVLMNSVALLSEPWRDKFYFRTHRGPMWVRDEKVRDDFQTVYDRALELSPPGSLAFTWPFSPQFNFLSGTINPTRFDHLVAGWHDTKQCQSVREVLSETSTEYLYYRPLPEEMIHGFPRLDPERFRADLESQKSLVVKDYSVHEELGGFQLFRRVEEDL